MKEEHLSIELLISASTGEAIIIKEMWCMYSSPRPLSWKKSNLWYKTCDWQATMCDSIKLGE